MNVCPYCGGEGRKDGCPACNKVLAPAGAALPVSRTPVQALSPEERRKLVTAPLYFPTFRANGYNGASRGPLHTSVRDYGVPADVVAD